MIHARLFTAPSSPALIATVSWKVGGAAAAVRLPRVQVTTLGGPGS